MKPTITGHKVLQQATRSKTSSSAGPHGVAVAPPSYGIDFSDHAAAPGGETVLQRMGKPEEEEKKLLQAKSPVQRQALEEEEEPMQAKLIQRLALDEEEEPLQAKGLLQREAAPSPAAEARPQNRTGLPDALKSGVEALSGLSLDDVRVHTNSPKPAELQALAYTQGTDIHVAPGQERHLPHEAWHVVQQKQGRVKPTMQLKDVPVNDDTGLEHEADVKGMKAFQLVDSQMEGIRQNNIRWMDFTNDSRTAIRNPKDIIQCLRIDRHFVDSQVKPNIAQVGQNKVGAVLNSIEDLSDNGKDAQPTGNKTTDKKGLNNGELFHQSAGKKNTDKTASLFFTIRTDSPSSKTVPAYARVEAAGQHSSGSTYDIQWATNNSPVSVGKTLTFM